MYMATEVPRGDEELGWGRWELSHRVGDEGAYGELEEGVQSRPSGIQSCDARRSSDDTALVGMLSDVVKEGSLPRACLAGEEDIASCVGDEVLDVLLALHG